MMAGKSPSDLRLTRTDFDILNALREGRNVPSNIAEEIDKSRKYVTNQMSYLLDYGLVERVGPVERAGLYELTPKGDVVEQLRDKYYDDDVDFDALVDEELERRSD